MSLVFIHIYLVVVQCLDFTLIDSPSQKKKKKEKEYLNKASYLDNKLKKKQFLSDCLIIYIYIYIKEIVRKFCTY